jgi:hypothetical protein
MKRKRLPRGEAVTRLIRRGRAQEGKVGSRTPWSKERGGPDSGTEPYDARVSRTVPLRRV